MIDEITLLMSLKSMSSQSVDVLLSEPFTTDIKGALLLRMFVLLV